VGPEVLDDPLAAGYRIAGDLLQWFVVTEGARGVTASSDDQILKVSAREVTPVDTTGAGDSFAAGLVHALVSGASMADALQTGVNWGGEATLWESSVLPQVAVQRLIQ
jgi:sugar/nucleoside kinase (ribokinase family)